MVRKNFKLLLFLLTITIIFITNMQVVKAGEANLKFKSIDLTMSFKDSTLPQKGNEPITSATGSFKNTSDVEVCTEIPIVKWMKRESTMGQWDDIAADDTFEAGYYYKPVFGTCVYNEDTYSIDTTSTMFKVNGADIDQNSEPGNLYTNWTGFYVDDTILINSLYQTIIEPKVGEMPTTTIDVTTDPEGAYKVSKINISWLESPDGTIWKPMDLNTPFKSGKYYMSEGVAGDYLSDGYVDRKSFQSSVQYSSLDTTEYFTSYINGVEVVTPFKIYGPIYSYKFLDETGKQEVNVGNIKELSFRVDCSIDLFKGISIGNINLIKDEDYELTEGSTIIKLTNNGLSKINKLKAGNYDVKVSFNNDKELLLGSLVIKDISNPKTGDNVALYIFLGLISMFCLTSTGIYLKKKLIN